MKKVKAVIAVIFMLFSLTSSDAQHDSLFVLPDTAKVLTLDNFYFQILNNHPVAKQVNLMTDVARQEVRLARGNFDPKLEIQYLKKNYDNIEYYDLFNGVLKFPTVFPIDPKIGVERNQGQYISPESYLSGENNYQQFYTGVSLPLARGLITDERRTALKQAKLFGEMTEADQIKLMNKLLLDAAKDYWQWYFAYYNYRIQNKGVSIAREIFKRVKISALQGEAATIDTVQAKTTLLERLVQQQEALLDFKNNSILVSTYLWDSLSNPQDLTLNWAPVRPEEIWTLTRGALDELKEKAKQQHPELKKLSVKLRQLENERKLAIEYIKPKVDVSYSLLNQPLDPNWNSTLVWGDNYKLGLDVAFPLYIRKERAKLMQTKIKLSSTQFEKNLAERQVVNQIESSYNVLLTTATMISQLSSMVENYERMLTAEFLNLENGESDLFKINVQQDKLIQAQGKYLKMLCEYEKNKAVLYWAAGVRNLGLL